LVLAEAQLFVSGLELLFTCPQLLKGRFELVLARL